MGRRQNFFATHSARGAGIAVTLALLMASRASLAATVNVTGGGGLDQGALCVTGALCPSTPTYSLIGTDPVTGSFTYNPITQTVNFNLTLTANANFGSETLLAGSTFSAANVSVAAISLGLGATEVSQNAAATGLANVNFSPGLSEILNAPAISGLTCTIGTGSDQCGVSFGAAGFEVGPDSHGVDYNGFLTFNMNVTPVPVPGSAWLLLSGLGLMSLRRPKLQQG